MRRLTQELACATDLVLDEWSSGELDEPTNARIAEHVAGCARCAARHASHEALRASFLTESPSFGVHAVRFGPREASVPRAPAPRRRWLHSYWDAIKLALASLATAGLTAFAVLLIARWTDAREPLRTKGAAHIDFYVKRGSDVRRGERGDTLAPGDALRFTYTNPQRSYFALFNLDAQAASIYFPGAASAVPLRGGSQVALDFSVELDAQLGEERVFGVFCSEPFELEPLRAALKANGGLPARPGCQFDVITIHKEPAGR